MDNNKNKMGLGKVVLGMYLVSLTVSLVTEAHDDPFVQESLCATNAVREREGKNLPPVTWNDTVACYARDYAKKRQCDCKMEHSNVENPKLCYGENLAMGWGDFNVTSAVEAWYAEKPDYCFATDTCTPGKMCGHYTQLVWKNTAQIGCAAVKCDNTATWVICNYWPPGNVHGQKAY